MRECKREEKEKRNSQILIHQSITCNITIILFSLSLARSRFTRDIKPSDISLSFLRGKGELRNLDLNTDVISSALQLPPWISIDHVFCDMIKLDIPFTDLNKSPIKCVSIDWRAWLGVWLGGQRK